MAISGKKILERREELVKEFGESLVNDIYCIGCGAFGVECHDELCSEDHRCYFCGNVKYVGEVIAVGDDDSGDPEDPCPSLEYGWVCHACLSERKRAELSGC